MIYHVSTDLDPEPIAIEASSSKWAARKWARLYWQDEGDVTVHVRQPGGLLVSWAVWSETILVYRMRVAT